VRRHVHPLTPIINAVSVIPALAFTGAVFTFAVNISLNARLIALGSAILIAVPLLVAGYSYLTWRRLWFWFDDDGDFRVDSGIVFRNQRRLQLSRLQTVDIVRPFIPRIMGFAAVVIEVAGTGDSRVQLRYLTSTQAQRLRAEVIERAAGRASATETTTEIPRAVVPPGRLALSLLLRTSTVGLIALTAIILTVTVFREGWSGLVIALVTGSLPVALVIGEFIQYFGFTITRASDGLRLRFGLLQTQTRTVPPGRVQAVDIVAPLLWRPLGWVRVRVNIAGVGTGSEQGQRETLLTPVAPRDEAHALVQDIFPSWNPGEPLRRRAPRRARWRAPLQWSRLAMDWDDETFQAQRGRITRHHMVIPHSRTQSVRWHQGPWQRLLSLASIALDSTPGPVQVVALHQDAVFARQAAEEQAVHARVSRRRDAQRDNACDENAHM